MSLEALLDLSATDRERSGVRMASYFDHPEFVRALRDVAYTQKKRRPIISDLSLAPRFFEHLGVILDHLARACEIPLLSRLDADALVRLRSAGAEIVMKEALLLLSSRSAESQRTGAVLARSAIPHLPREALDEAALDVAHAAAPQIRRIRPPFMIGTPMRHGHVVRAFMRVLEDRGGDAVGRAAALILYDGLSAEIPEDRESARVALRLGALSPPLSDRAKSVFVEEAALFASYNEAPHDLARLAIPLLLALEAYPSSDHGWRLRGIVMRPDVVQAMRAIGKKAMLFSLVDRHATEKSPAQRAWERVARALFVQRTE